MGAADNPSLSRYGCLTNNTPPKILNHVPTMLVDTKS